MNDFSLRLSVFYGVLFLLVGIMLPFFPLWLKWKELEAFEISVILSAPLFLRLLFTPGISFISDRLQNHRLTIILLSWGTLLTICLLFVIDGFTPLLLASILFSLFWMTIMPLTETIAMAGVREEGQDYGRMRLWGSITFILISTGGGVIIKTYGPEAVPWMLVLVSAAVIICAYGLPKREKTVVVRDEKIQFQDIVRLIFSPVFFLFLIGASLIQATHAMYYSFGSVHWQSQQISADVVGILWAIGVIAETVLFAFSRPVLQALGGVWLLLIAGIACVLRWTVMAFDPGVETLFVLQALHSLTFGAGHLGAIFLIGMMVPNKYSATAQGLYAALSSGFIMGIAIYFSGPVYHAYKGEAYLAMSLLGAGSIIAVLILSKIWNGKTLPDPAEKRNRQPAVL